MFCQVQSEFEDIMTSLNINVSVENIVKLMKNHFWI